MNKHIKKALPELIEAEIITPATADKIVDFYEAKASDPQRRLLIVFGILGSILVGTGIILILAHNWDNLSRLSKTILAFSPLIISQALCGYTIFKKTYSVAWRESTAILLFFAIGACMALVSQVYNISGSLDSFVLTWTILALPIIYIMRSSMASLLYLAFISWYVVLDWNYGYYWLLLAGALPHYFNLIKRDPASNFLAFHHWLIPISAIFGVAAATDKHESLIVLALLSAFAVYYQIGRSKLFESAKLRTNAYLILGSLGTALLLIITSFDEFWSYLYESKYTWTIMVNSKTFATWIVAFLLAVVGGSRLVYRTNLKTVLSEYPKSVVFVLFSLAFLLAQSGDILPIIIVNLLIVWVGMASVITGIKSGSFTKLNYGLVLLTILIVCRFFDMDISFVIKGLIYIALGVTLFVVNYVIMKRKRSTAQLKHQ
ncbi:MAG: DUF2157 domain-containing protein [Bacteroidota bacterium]